MGKKSFPGPLLQGLYSHTSILLTAEGELGRESSSPPKQGLEQLKGAGLCQEVGRLGVLPVVAGAQTEAGSPLVGSLVEDTRAEGPQKAVSQDDKSTESVTQD